MISRFVSVFLCLCWAMYSTKTQLCSGMRLPFKKRLTIPNPVRSNVPNTWAYDTMSRRIHENILPRIIEDNSEELTYPSSPLRSECLLLLNDLKASLECGKSGVLRGIVDSGSDVDTWTEILQSIPEQERNWLDGPWVVTEFYFYRRIVEAFRYFETGYDMFIKQKFTGLVDAMPYIGEIARSLPLLLETSSISNSLDLAIFTSLWGNKMDLSIWPSLKSQSNTNGNEDTSNNKKELTNSGEISSDTAAMLAIRSYILDDHTDKVTQLLLDIKQKKDSNGTPVEIGIVVDNAGYELVSDFILGHCLLALGVADVITFHTKAHPTFVSDATTQDCYGHISYLVDADNSNTAMLGKHFQRYVEAGKFVFDDDVFWCQPTAFWDMPPAIQEKLSQSKLVFVKGDANYRRLLGEREWPLATPADDILSYWPVPVCALRTFKAELGCGIDSISEKRAKELDPSWMVSGKWGVVQLGGV